MILRRMTTTKAKEEKEKWYFKLYDSRLNSLMVFQIQETKILMDQHPISNPICHFNILIPELKMKIILTVLLLRMNDISKNWTNRETLFKFWKQIMDQIMKKVI